MTRFVTTRSFLYNTSGMSTTLSAKKVNAVLEHVDEAARIGPASLQAAPRQPVHVVYGGAHLFAADTPSKLGRIALSSLDSNTKDFARAIGIDDDALAKDVLERVRKKLETDPVEALCIDFEDGFGERGEGEESAHAIRTAEALATMPEGRPIIGIRVKPLSGTSGRRAAKTLDLFVTTLARARGSALRDGFTVTLPKVSRTAEVLALVELLDMLESALGIRSGRIGVELMVESPRALFDDEGRLAARALVNAARGRCRAVHLGAYDLTASLGVTATDQRLDHPFCDAARILLGIALAQTPVAISDGVTTVLPVKDGVHDGWKLHASNVRHALEVGIWQGWDVHPAQLPARYGALYAYFRRERTKLAERLATFVERATRASRTGQLFDDASTAQGILNFFLRGLACGALDDMDVAATTLSRLELESRSFADIVAARSSAEVTPSSPGG